MKYRSKPDYLMSATSRLLPILIAALSGSAPPAEAQRLESAPPGWRSAGSTKLEFGSFRSRPLDPAKKGNRPISKEKQGKASTEPALPAFGAGEVGIMSTTASSDADYRTPELVALAAGLQNDRDLIFSWVRDHIRYVHYHGCKKGAHLTYLERSGNDIDQSALLVALWRAAGIDCRYVRGLIELPETTTNQIDWYHYLGVDASELGQLVFSRGTPDGEFGIFEGHATNTKALSRVWVEANIGGGWYAYDPSFKLTQPETGLNLASEMGYSRASLLSSLGAGTSGTNSITSLDYAGLGTYLSARVTQFLSAFRSSHFEKTVGQTVGGWKPLEHATVANSSFPVDAAGYFWGGYIGETYDVLPATFYATLQIQASSVGLNWGPVNLASLRGQRLGLAFESSKATLKIEDGQVAQATSTTASGVPLNVSVSIVHAESPGVVPGVQVNESVTLGAKGGGTYQPVEKPQYFVGPSALIDDRIIE